MNLPGRKRGRPPGIKTRSEFDNPSPRTEDLINRLDEVASPKRIAAAKRAAKNGRVVELTISPGLIEAKVQGKRKTPYTVRIYTTPPDVSALEDVVNRLREKAKYKASLLMSTAPPELDGIFKSSGMALSFRGFMKSRKWCACPEQGDICEHILAAVYVAAAAFDRDPFMLMRLRGLEKGELLELLCAPSDEKISLAARAPVPDEPQKCDAEPQADAYIAPPSTDADFYCPSDLPDELNALENLSPEARRPAPLLDFPLWRGETPFVDSLVPYYKTVKKYISGRR
ncbi:MAG: SWIM zinc finger family protein [Synergistaceae bacterium]|nr:SWIM zinc finger family protein [Synergistaceae bacterium]